MTSYEDLAQHAWKGAEAAAERDQAAAEGREDEGDPSDPRNRTPRQKLARARRLIEERRTELAAEAAAKGKADREAARTAHELPADGEPEAAEPTARELVDAGQMFGAVTGRRSGASKDPSIMAEETLAELDGLKNVDEMTASEMVEAAGIRAKPPGVPTFRAGRYRNAPRNTRD